MLKDLQEKAVKAARKRHEEALADEKVASEHTLVQHVLIRIGRALGYDIFVARNDRHRVCHGDHFSQLTLPALPEFGFTGDVRDTVELIDVLWLFRDERRIACGFEAEHVHLLGHPAHERPCAFTARQLRALLSGGPGEPRAGSDGPNATARSEIVDQGVPARLSTGRRTQAPLRRDVPVWRRP